MIDEGIMTLRKPEGFEPPNSILGLNMVKAKPA
jgi:hypothetical protein